MRFTVTTENGSFYEFNLQDGLTIFRQGDLLGKVISFKDSSITVGNSLSFEYHSFGMHNHTPTLVTTDPIKEISIIL